MNYKYCQVCGISSSYRYADHHIVYRSEAPKHKELNNPRNLITLCESCHSWFHSDKKLRNDLVERRNLEELFNLKLLR